MIGKTLSHYRIDRRLGEGGMGEVYAARDLKLERDVAIKMLREDLADPALRERFWREARAAAQLNHPNICQIFEVREEAGRPCIVMELLEGETLAERLVRAPLEAAEAVKVGAEVLEALAALHRRGFVHRDVKPSNVFLLADGRVKLLDFGLVLPVNAAPGGDPSLTLAGTVIGSPRTMAPEQIRGGAVDARTDLFALAASLHEAVTGRPVFRGRAPLEIFYSVLNDPAPPLRGTPMMEGLWRVLERALSKEPERRPASAEAMAAELVALSSPPAAAAPAPAAERVVRLAVLPFRMLRPDPAHDFLGPSLADAIAMSLAGIHTLVVRSPMVAARFAGDSPDLREIAAALDVDVVLTGTVLSGGGRIRVAAQLLEAPGGRMAWSQTSDAGGPDVFDIQDRLARRIVESLELPLTAGERRALDRDVPANPTAYEYFLRGTRATQIDADLTVARDLCRTAVDADPHYAPAWTSLGRCYRLIGKYRAPEDREENFRLAREAIGRALELAPDLPAAHHLAAHFELDLGETETALERLIGVVERNPNDPQGFNGLIAAFRYLGMLEESGAAFRRVRQLDPAVVTSYLHTLDSLGEYARALEEPSSGFGFDRGRMLLLLGRTEDGLRYLEHLASQALDERYIPWLTALRSVAERDAEKAARALAEMEDFPDPEGLTVIGRCRVAAGDVAGGLRVIEKAVGQGYANVTLLRRDPWLEAARALPEFRALLERADARHRAAVASYRGRIPGLVADSAAVPSP